MDFKERRFAVPGLTLAAKEWGSPGGAPLLAAHGWLDNAGSFDRLAPRLLPDCHLLAVDSAGHGFSDHRSADAAYNLWQEVGDLTEIADQMGWERFSLLGHSRGAAVAILLAGTFPQRIERLVVLDGGIPILGTAAEAPDQLAASLLETKRLRGRAGRIYPDRELALAERANGLARVELATAEILARRSLRPVDGGFRWHADQRLKATSELRLTDAHMQAFAGRVTAPVLAFVAEDSPFAHSAANRRLLARFANAAVIELPGGHHFHLEGAEAAIADGVMRFLFGGLDRADAGRLP